MNEEQNIKQLPKGWRFHKLSEVGAIISGGTPSTSIPEYWNGDISWISPADLTGYKKKEIAKGAKSITTEGLKKSSARLMPKGAVLFSSRAPIGYVAIASNELATNQGFKSIIPNDNVDSCYLYYFLKSAKRMAENVASGTTFKEISLSKFSDLNIPLPPLPTQTAIVAKIEELFSDLDKGIEQLKTAQQQLKTYRQAILKWAFEGRLTNENVKDGELPEGWKWVKTIDVIHTINNGYTPTKEYLSEGAGEIPFIKVYNLNFNGTLNFKKNPTFIPEATHKKDLKRSICLPGDVLINIVGPPLGKVSIVTNQYPEWNINQAIVMFRPNEKVLSRYISYFLQNTVTINWLENTSKATAGQWNVKVSTCREIPFPFCSIEEQNNIIQEIESRLSIADKMEESITQSLQQAETLRQSILKQAFEGKLVNTIAKVISFKPKNQYFFDCQILGYIIRASKKKNIWHGEMTLAKYAYVAVKIFGIPLSYIFQQWHLGPYAPEIKKAINNKQFFLHAKSGLELADELKLLKYTNPYLEQTEKAVDELITIFEKYDPKDRPNKTELFATVCKVIEDTSSTDLSVVRHAMRNWKIELKNSLHKSKAEKFNEEETMQCIGFIISREWHKKLIINKM